MNGTNWVSLVAEILVYTRHWIHYGFLAFVFFVILAAAAKGLLAG